jgi:hypothetical protein
MKLKNLCYKCKEQWTQGHQCKIKGCLNAMKMEKEQKLQKNIVGSEESDEDEELLADLQELNQNFDLNVMADQTP